MTLLMPGLDQQFIDEEAAKLEKITGGSQDGIIKEFLLMESEELKRDFEVKKVRRGLRNLLLGWHKSCVAPMAEVSEQQ